MTSEFLTLDQVADAYPVSIGTLRHWIALGRLAAFRPGRRVLVRRVDVEHLITNARVGAT